MTKFHIMDIPLFKEWLKEKRHLADGSVYVYTIAVSAFLKTEPDLENLQDYNDFLIKSTIKKRTGYSHHALKHFIDFKIVNDGQLKNRLKEGLINPKPVFNLKQERKHLKEEKIFEVINLLQEKHRIISIIQHLTGVRAGDIMRIKRGNIQTEEYKEDLALRLIIIGKREKRNIVYIHDKVAQELIMDYIVNNYHHDVYYFIEERNRKSTTANFTSDFDLYQRNYWKFWVDLKHALQSSGISREDFATHDFRRCFARRAWEKYKDIHILQKLLNHTDPKTTLRYLEQSGLQNADYHHEMQM